MSCSVTMENGGRLGAEEAVTGETRAASSAPLGLPIATESA